MYILQLQFQVETSLVDASVLNTLATKKTKCSKILLLPQFCFVFAFTHSKKDLNSICYRPGTMLNTEDTKINKG